MWDHQVGSESRIGFIASSMVGLAQAGMQTWILPEGLLSLEHACSSVTRVVGLQQHDYSIGVHKQAMFGSSLGVLLTPNQLFKAQQTGPQKAEPQCRSFKPLPAPSISQSSACTSTTS